MGQEQSAEEANGTPEPSPQDGGVGSKERLIIDDEEDDIDVETLSAYRVMKVFQGSPSSRSGLRPFEDFIVAVNGSLVDSDKASLANVLRDNEGKQVGLIVYNVIDDKKRDVALRPVKWNGPGLLGAAVRYEPIAGAIEHVLRVMDVLPNSPASQAGLMPNSDYIVGTPAEVFRNETEFTKMVRHSITIGFPPDDILIQTTILTKYSMSE